VTSHSGQRYECNEIRVLELAGDASANRRTVPMGAFGPKSARPPHVALKSPPCGYFNRRMAQKFKFGSRHMRYGRSAKGQARTRRYWARFRLTHPLSRTYVRSVQLLPPSLDDLIGVEPTTESGVPLRDLQLSALRRNKRTSRLYREAVAAIKANSTPSSGAVCPSIPPHV
jgi:hypothetical protein